MRLAILLNLILVVLAADAPAESSDRSDRLENALRQLASGELRDRAWGAYRASEHRLQDAVPLIRRNLGRLPGRDTDRGVAVARAAGLDAIARMNVTLPPDELTPHAFGEHVGAVLVLLMRMDPAPVESLLGVLDRHDAGLGTVGWLATGNLLLARRTPGFAARVLARLETQIEVQVRSVADFRAPSAIICSDGMYRLPDDFPPLVLYALSQRKSKEDTLLASGIRPVYVHRQERRNGGRFGTVTGCRDPDRNDYRAEWIDHILRQAGATLPRDGIRRHRWWRLQPVEWGTKSGPPGHVRVAVRWAGEAPFRRQLRREGEACHVTFWDTVRALVEAGWVDPEEARRLMPRIRYRLRDQRSRRAVPLPTLQPPPATNPWALKPRPRANGIVVRGPASTSPIPHVRQREVGGYKAYLLPASRAHGVSPTRRRFVLETPS
jgi:hypothetical protein